MNRKKLWLRSLLVPVLLAIGYGVFYAWRSFPIISGFSAKNACSCMFLQGRSKEMVQKEELGSFPLSLGSIEVNLQDSSVTGSVWGMAKRKAIYRAGLGCTLVNDMTEQELRSQHFELPPAFVVADSISWPDGDRPVGNLIWVGRYFGMGEVMRDIFSQQFQGKDVGTRAVLVVHQGKIIAERYAKGYDRHSKFLGWSMAKSITSALIGILVRQGRLDVVAPAPVEEWKEDADRKKITTEQLLQQTSGLDFVENYARYSDVTNMLFNRGDMAKYVAGRKLKQEPGSAFYYSSGNSNLLSRIIRTTVGEKDYHRFAYDELFHRIGMEHTLLEPDASGTFVGSSYVFGSARDYARLGLLYLNDGVWDGQRILPEGWVRRSVTAPAGNAQKNYGYQFWLNGWDGSDAHRREFPEAPEDMFYADGFGGQRIYIIPSRELVIVRMGLRVFDEHAFLKGVLDAVGR